MKLKILIGLLVVLIALNLGTIGSYLYLQLGKERDKKEFRPPYTGYFEPHKRPELNLDRGQRRQLAVLLREFYRESKDRRLEIRQLEFDIFNSLQNENVNDEQIKKNLRKISDLRFEISQMAIQKMREAKQFLSPEQQRRFFNAIMEKQSSMSEGRGHIKGPNFPSDLH